MIRSTLLALVAPVAIAATLFSPAKAEAANRFAVVGIENTTQHTVRLSHKWGDGQWRTDVLKPGERKWFWHTYTVANENKSPRFHVKFDSDLKPGEVFTINYDLKKNAAPAHDWENAHKYAFKYDGNKTFIDLYEKK
ncbi:MAG TPA: hypothetical protein VGE74_02185 [Gemmata sp.]